MTYRPRDSEMESGDDEQSSKLLCNIFLAVTHVDRAG